MSEKVDGGTIIVGNYEVAMQLTQQRTIKISGYIYSDETNEAVNGRLDAAQDALDRQYVRADIVSKEAQIQSIFEDLSVHAEHYKAVLEKKSARARGENVRMLTQDKELIDKYDMNVKAMNAKLASLQAAVKTGKQKLNGALAQ